jgi:hypothetical protein
MGNLRESTTLFVNFLVITTKHVVVTDIALVVSLTTVFFFQWFLSPSSLLVMLYLSLFPLFLFVLSLSHPLFSLSITSIFWEAKEDNAVDQNIFSPHTLSPRHKMSQDIQARGGATSMSYISSVISTSTTTLKNLYSASASAGASALKGLGDRLVGPTPVACSRKRYVLHKSFEKTFRFLNRIDSYLALGLRDGFQLYRLHSATDVRRVLAHKDVPISCVRIVSPHENRSHQYTASTVASFFVPSTPAVLQPVTSNNILLAVTAADDHENFTRSMVKIYSSSSSKYEYVLRLHANIVGLQTSANGLLLVGTEREIHVFRVVLLVSPPATVHSGNTFVVETCFSAPVFPQPSGLVAALGPRWLAYPACEAYVQPPSPNLTPSTCGGGPPAFSLGSYDQWIQPLTHSLLLFFSLATFCNVITHSLACFIHFSLSFFTSPPYCRRGRGEAACFARRRVDRKPLITVTGSPILRRGSCAHGQGPEEGARAAVGY